VPRGHVVPWPQFDRLGQHIGLWRRLVRLHLLALPKIKAVAGIGLASRCRKSRPCGLGDKTVALVMC